MTKVSDPEFEFANRLNGAILAHPSGGIGGRVQQSEWLLRELGTRGSTINKEELRVLRSAEGLPTKQQVVDLSEVLSVDGVWLEFGRSAL